MTAGVSYNILQETTTTLPHVEGHWIPDVRKFLSKISASLQIGNTQIVQQYREGDFYLMDKAISSNCFRKDELCLLNYCRLYLKVQSIAGGAAMVLSTQTLLLAVGVVGWAAAN